MPLGADQAQEEFLVGNLLFLCSAQLLLEELRDLAQVQALEQLFELFAHGLSPFLGCGNWK